MLQVKIKNSKIKLTHQSIVIKFLGEKNANKYGIPLMITSVGTIQGKFIQKGTSPYVVIKTWDNDYKQFPNKSSYSPQSSA